MKFNQTNTNKTTNLAGGHAYKILNLKQKLTLQVLTSFVSEEKYYGDNTKDILKNIDECMKTSDGVKFVRNLGIFARREFNMRSISHVIAEKLASNEMTTQIARHYIPEVCLRPDDMLEIASINRSNNNNKVVACVKKGIAEAFHKFDQYQLAKYRGKKKSLKLKDLINITHPKPQNDIESALYKSILDDTITAPMTWEVEISKIKKDDVDAVRTAWENLIASRNEKGMFTIGIMALIRNLKNILKSNVSNQTIDIICNRLTDARTIQNSKQFPFRFYSAYVIVERECNQYNNYNKVLMALEKSIELAVINMPKFKGKTCIFVDESGSMSTPISKNSMVTAKDIANLFAAITVKMSNDTVVIPFAEFAKKIYLSPNDSIFTNMKKLENANVGYATYLDKAYKIILEENIEFDRIIVFSDFQTYESDMAISNRNKSNDFENYKKLHENCKLHSLDLIGYGTSIADPNKPNVNLYGGFSEKSLQLMVLAEEGITSLVEKIENYANGLVIDIYLQSTKVAEFINLNMIVGKYGG